MYDDDPVYFAKIKQALKKVFGGDLALTILLVVLLSSLFGLAGGIASSFYLNKMIFSNNNAGNIVLPGYAGRNSQEQQVISAVSKYSPAVVSVIISKNVPIMQQYFYNPFGDGSPFGFEIPGYRQNGTQKQDIGGGSGFIVSGDGMILTNKHVVSDGQADYTVLTNDGQKYPAKVLAIDPMQDLALIKISATGSKSFPVMALGDSDNLQIGQTVIAIGNALGEFRNTVSVGVVSGLGRTISASGSGGSSETLEDIIQTDAAINPGNSGGPLLNLKGEVIGINTAIAEGGQSIGFTIPINQAKRDIQQVAANGKIVYPFLGIRYTLINADVQSENKFTVDYGAWVQKGSQGEAAVTAGSPAEKAGIKENDIVLELNNEKITEDNSLSKIIQKYNPGDKVTLKILRDKKEMDIGVTLSDRSS
jgi:serine protease Do